MKKILFSVALIGATFVGATAQNVGTTLLDEHFEVIPNGDWWRVVDFSGSDPAVHWGIANANVFQNYGFASRCAVSNTFKGGDNPVPYDVDNGLASVSATVPAGDLQLVLTYRIGGVILSDPPGGSLRYEVYIVGDEPNNPNYNPFAAGELFKVFEETITESTTTALDRSVNILVSSYTATVPTSAIRIMFNHVGSTGFGQLLLDDVKLISNSEVVGTEDFATTSFSVYPNPATDLITISNGTDLIENAIITDLNGKVVKQVTLGVNEGQINISDLSQGVYLMNATANGKVITEKIVKK